MNKTHVRILGIVILVVIAFTVGYFTGYENGKEEVLEYIHKDVPDYNEQEEDDTDPVI